MEQKKTLWIIAAVGAFLLVVLGAACILYSPAARPYSPTAQIAQTEPKQNSSGWTNQSGSQTSVTPVAYPDNLAPAAKVNDMVVVSDNTTVYGLNSEVPQNSTAEQMTTIDLNALKRELSQEAPITAQPQNINITVNIPEPVKETTIITSTPEYAETTKVAGVKPASKTAQTSVEKVTKVPANAKNKKPAAPAPAKEVKQEPKKITQFWVQVAAYSNKKSAEIARSILDENKIPADIFTYKDNKDKLFYRVRIGPYTTKSEAEYWKTKIVKIDDFAKSESYVTSTVK